MGAPYTQTGVLAKERANGPAEGIWELGRELELAGVRPPTPSPLRRGAAAGRGLPRKSINRRPTGGGGLSQRAWFGLRKRKGAPRVQVTGGARGGRPPEDGGTQTLEANRTGALQGVTKEEGTFRGRRKIRGGKRHEKFAKALVGGTTRFDSRGVESFALSFGLSGPAPLLPQSSLLCGGTCPGGGSHANVFPARATSDNASAHVGEACSMPSSAVGSVGSDEEAVYCFLFISPSVAWAAGLSRLGYPPPEPGPPP